jgi:hypothetical protein
MRVLALGALALALPALAAPAPAAPANVSDAAAPDLDRRARWVKCDNRYNHPKWSDCTLLFDWYRDQGSNLMGGNGNCLGECCVLWSRDGCAQPAHEVLWRARDMRAMCERAGSASMENAGSCFGSMCLSNGGSTCTSSWRVDEPWK